MRVETAMTGSELCDAMREVRLQNSDVQPYADADISMRSVRLAECRPVSLYVLTDNLKRQLALRASLLGKGVDPLSLDGSLNLRTDDGESVAMLPPIVEEDPEHGPLLIDGTHRTYVGRSLGYDAVKALYITGSHPEYPVYAFPNEWSAIREHHSVPTDLAEKKHYRPGDYRALYRDFSSLNGSRMREAGDAN